MNWHLSISWKIKRDTLDRQTNIYQILLIMMIIEYCFLAFLFSFNLLGNDSMNHKDRNFYKCRLHLNFRLYGNKRKEQKETLLNRLTIFLKYERRSYIQTTLA